MAKYIDLPKRAINITGERFGRLVAIGPVGVKRRQICWECLCDCGNLAVVRLSNLRNGTAQSCGCLHREITGAIRRTHGKSHSRVFYIWVAIKQRCSNPNNKAYKNYGGRGISMCAEWRESFDSFFAYVSQLPNFGVKGYTLDRSDNNRGYEIGNMRWATRLEQNRNKRQQKNAHLLTHNGKTQPLHAWAVELGMAESTLKGRIDDNWGVERSLTTPIQSSDVVLTHNGKTQRVADWARELDVPVLMLYKRLYRGWDTEKTLTTPRRIRPRRKNT